VARAGHLDVPSLRAQLEAAVMSRGTLPEQLRVWAANREALNLDTRLLERAADEIDKLRKERLELRARSRKLAAIEEVLNSPPDAFMEINDAHEAIRDIVEDRR
jgi:hypothetical protein